MKTFKFKLLLGLITILTLSSCSETNNFNEITNKEQNVNIKYKWQEQLQYAMNNANYNDELELLGYSEAGFINTENEKKDYLLRTFDNKSYFTHLNDSESGYTVCTRAKLLKDHALDDDFFTNMEDAISSKIVIGQTRLLELYWEYKGIKITTNAIAYDDERGIIFDPIASLSPNPREDQSKRFCGRINTYRELNTRTDDWNYNGYTKYNSQLVIFHVEGQSENSTRLNKPYWKFHITVTAVFSNNDLILRHKAIDYNSESNAGWQCDAAAITIDGQPDYDMYHRFEYAWIYAYGVGAYINFSNSGLSLVGIGVGDHEHDRILQVHPDYYNN